jgi:cytoskeletal protein CcmA (bactofilin family)
VKRGKITDAISIKINGIVEGSLTGKENVTLQPRVSLKGDLITRRMIIEAGPLFTGKVK